MRTNRSEFIANRGLSQGAAAPVRRTYAKPAPAAVGINWSLCIRLGVIGATLVTLIGGAL